MTNELLAISGWKRLVSEPDYSGVHQGISPGGASDLFSYHCGVALCGASIPAYETIGIITLTALADCFVVMTGARIRYTANAPHHWQNYQPFSMKKGDRLTLPAPDIGFRRYVFALPKPQFNINLLQLNPQDLFDWQPPSGTIRIMPAPESFLLDLQTLLNNRFVVEETTPMACKIKPLLTVKASQHEMISSPVTHGTLQMAPQGFYVLGATRQTVGGYPRIATVLSADMDILAQYPPNASFRFDLADVELGVQLLKQQQEKLAYLAQQHMVNTL